MQSIIENNEKIIFELEKNLTQGEYVIHEHCNELIRLIQLSTEIKIQKVKKLNDIHIDSDDFENRQIIELLDLNDILIHRVKQYEQSSLNHYQNLHLSNLIKKIKEFKIFLNFFSYHWKNKRLIKKPCLKLEKFNSNLDRFKEELNMKIFNDNLMKYNTETDQLYFKKSIHFKQLTKIEHKNIIFDLQNGFLFTAFQLNKSQVKFACFNIFNNEIKNELVLNCERILKIISNKDLIAFHLMNKNKLNPSIIIMNKNFEILTEKLNLDYNDELFSADSKYLYFKYVDWPKEFCIDVFDWNLNKINIKFQTDDLTMPFYIPSNIESISSINDRFIYSFKQNSNESLNVLVSNDGISLASFKSESSFYLDKSNNFYLICQNNLLKHNSEGALLESLSLIDFRNEIKSVIFDESLIFFRFLNKKEFLMIV